jgi:hypothetical protein
MRELYLRIMRLDEGIRELVWEIKCIFSSITARLRLTAKRMEETVKNRLLIPGHPRIR